MKKNFTLEVGSGDNPREKSDVLLDRYIHSNKQRAGEFSIRINRPMVVGNGYNLPFKDKAFDYVICSHVLEHLENPEKFIEELMRVGKAGYIEVPNIIGERLFGWGFHLWYCEYKNNKLTFTPKKHAERFGNFFHRLIANEIWFRRFFEKNENIFYIKFEWKNSFQVKVSAHEYSREYLEKIDKIIDKILESVEWDKKMNIAFFCKWMSGRIFKKVKKEIRQLFWNMQSFTSSKSIIEELLPKMKCIACNGNLNLVNSSIICTNCHSSYPLEGTIPIMLSKKEIEQGY